MVSSCKLVCVVLFLVPQVSTYLCPEDTTPLEPVVVQTSKGVVRGSHLNLTQLPILQLFNLHGAGDIFRGIPYAESTGGAMRFKRPVERSPWTGTLNAMAYGKVCPQRNKPDSKVSEDCLMLNVFTPKASPHFSFPVIFGIHGGGFVGGSASDFCPWGIIANLVRHGVVVVSIDYRLAALGFFTTKTDDYPANLGLLDQVAALKWVRKEIRNFGGDPARVTIIGGSAGAYSVDYHTYSPLSRGLFTKAIMESGTARAPWGIDGNDYVHNPSKQNAMRLCNITSAEWDAGQFAKLKPCLHSPSWQQLIHNTVGIRGPGYEVWPAVIDGPGGFLPEPLAKLAKTRVHDMPIIIGTCHDELVGTYLNAYKRNHSALLQWNKQLYTGIMQFVTPPQQFGSHLQQVRQVVNQYYIGDGGPNPADHIGWLKVVVQIESDKFFFAPAAHQAQEWLDVNNNPNVYMYSFDYASPALAKYYPPGYHPVTHSEEALYLFIIPAWDLSLFSPTDFKLINQMGLMWTNFAKFGKPFLNTMWRPISSSSRSNYLSINATSSMKAEYWAGSDRLWNHHIPSILNRTALYVV